LLTVNLTMIFPSNTYKKNKTIELKTYCDFREGANIKIFVTKKDTNHQ